AHGHSASRDVVVERRAMTSFERSSFERRLLLLAPTGKDAALTCSVLARVGIESHVCADMESLCRELGAGAGAVILTEEAVADNGAAPLRRVVMQQPPWS